MLKIDWLKSGENIVFLLFGGLKSGNYKLY